MIERIRFVLTNSSGEKIHGDFRYRRGEEYGNRAVREKPVVVICHSFMAFKDWGWFPIASERIAEAGFTTFIFNFSRNGVRGNANRVTEFGAFQQNTISHELEDVRIVLKAIIRGDVGAEIVGSRQIILLGHSRGGGIAIITAPIFQEIKGLITWSSVSTFDRWTPHQKDQWRKLGYLPLARDTAASPLKLGITLLEDVEKNRENLDITRAAVGIRIPWLLLHGKEDMLVRFSEAEHLYTVANKTTTEFAPLEKVGHVYDGSEVTDGSAIHRVIRLTTDWLKEHFS